MKNVMTNGFCELNEQEMMMTDGGWNPVTAVTNYLKRTDPFGLYSEAREIDKKIDEAHKDYDAYVTENQLDDHPSVKAYEATTGKDLGFCIGDPISSLY